MQNPSHETTDWLEISLKTDENHDADALEALLFAHGAVAVTLKSADDDQLLIEPTPGELPLWQGDVIVTGLFEQETDEQVLLTELATHIELPLHTHHLAERAWELEWAKYVKPLLFGEHLWICPSNQQIPASAQAQAKTQVITLDPGLAFGTGTHPTTAMALTFIAAQDFNTQHVMDFGTGSGILGIAACKQGAKTVYMTDIDEKALATAAENARINHVAAQSHFYLPDALPVLDAQIDCLLANILLAPLLALEPQFAKLCKPQATILLTGLLKSQTDAILEAYATDFTDFKITTSGDWAMVIAKRSA